MINARFSRQTNRQTRDKSNVARKVKTGRSKKSRGVREAAGEEIIETKAKRCQRDLMKMAGYRGME